jgi:hypothetical protein
MKDLWNILRAQCGGDREGAYERAVQTLLTMRDLMNEVGGARATAARDAICRADYNKALHEILALPYYQ